MILELREDGLLEIRTIAIRSVRRLLITLRREVILYFRTLRYDALRYLIKEPNYVLDLRNLKYGIFS